MKRRVVAAADSCPENFLETFNPSFAFRLHAVATPQAFLFVLFVH